MIIEKEIEIPSSSHLHEKYPYRQMNIGDSFFVKKEDMPKHVSTFHSLANRKGFKVKTRSIDDGIRVWRVE